MAWFSGSSDKINKTKETVERISEEIKVLNEVVAARHSCLEKLNKIIENQKTRINELEEMNAQLLDKIDKQDQDMKEIKQRMAKMEEVMRSNPIATFWKSSKESKVGVVQPLDS